MSMCFCKNKSDKSRLGYVYFVEIMSRCIPISTDSSWLEKCENVNLVSLANARQRGDMAMSTLRLIIRSYDVQICAAI